MAVRARAQRIKPKAGYHHGDLRRQLVVATRRLVDKGGADGFKLADAAALAGVSAAAPYRHFRDRQAILLAVSDDGFARLATAIAAGAARHEPGSVEAIRALGAAYIGFAREHPNVFRLMFAPHEGTGLVERGAEPEASSAGVGAYDVLVGQVSTHLALAPDAPAALATALSLWMYVHGFAALLIDDQLGVGRLEIDVDAMLLATTPGMLGAFVEGGER